MTTRMKIKVEQIEFRRTFGIAPIRWIGIVAGKTVTIENFGNGALPWRIRESGGVITHRGTTAKSIVRKALADYLVA